MILCLVATAFLVHSMESSGNTQRKTKTLNQHFVEMGTWKPVREIRLEPEVISVLKLDDYLYTTFSNGTDALSLYIGYYYTANKVGASHDPLVCFPGQGWVISNTHSGKFTYDPSAGSSVRYSSMIAQRGEEKEFVIYWFQSNRKSAADTFTQKVDSFYQKIKGMPEDNAFIRISIPVGRRSPEECLKITLEFIRHFYPRLLLFV